MFHQKEFRGNSLLSSNHGEEAFYERLIKTIKEPWKFLGRTELTFEEFMTVLSEIENVLYQRPLTYRFNVVNEPEPLTHQFIFC